MLYDTVQRPVIYLGLGITALAAVACSSPSEATPTSTPQPTRAVAVATATPGTLDETVIVLTPSPEQKPTQHQL